MTTNTTDILQKTLPKSLKIQDIVENRPTAPVLWYELNGKICGLPLQSANLSIEIHVSTAFVSLQAKFLNTTDKEVNGTFVFPCTGTVTSMKASIGPSRNMVSAYIPSEDLQQYQKEEQKKRTKASINETNPFDAYIPDLFRLPINAMKPGEEIQIQIDFLQNMTFEKQRYNLDLRLKMLPGFYKEGLAPKDVVKIKCMFNIVDAKVSFKSKTHSLRVVEEDSVRIEFEAVPRQHSLEDFNFCYWTSHDEVLPMAIQQNAPPNAADPRDSFLLFANPPTTVSEALPRDFVFVLDRSGSMFGTPYDEAVRALRASLDKLLPSDRFTIVAFDHAMKYFSQVLVPPTQENLDMVYKWAMMNPPRGGTNISKPLYWALEKLNEESKTVNGALCRLPIVLLITDGCVSKEKEIIGEVEKRVGNARLLTFGIGVYCNWFFLKILAEMGRGFSDSVVYPEEIYDRIVLLMDYANLPVLTNVTLEADNIENVEVYPFPIPDLYAGSPITLSGKYTGQFPKTIALCGTLPNGETTRIPVQTTFTEVIPVDRVFLKQQVDLLTAKYWLEENAEQKEKIVNISCDENIPSPFTTMVAFETDRDYLLFTDDEEKKEKGSKNSKLKKALLGAGLVMAVGVATFSSGDLAATGSNMGMADLFGTSGGGICDACGDMCDGLEE